MMSQVSDIVKCKQVQSIKKERKKERKKREKEKLLIDTKENIKRKRICSV
jgi:hypothetical protein